MSKPETKAGETADKKPMSPETVIERLLKSEKPGDSAAVLDALTFADPDVKQSMNGSGEFISHDELMRRLDEEV